MPRHRTVTDDDILSALARTITRRGVPDLTLQDVSREAGLSPATLLQRFGSKRGLLLALAERAPAEVRRSFRRAPSSPSALQSVRDVLSTMPQVTTREELVNDMTFLQMDLTDPAFHALALRHAEIFNEETAALITQAIDTGELPADVDGAELTRAVRITYDGAMIQWALTGEGTLNEAIGTALDVLFNAHRKEEK